MSILFVPVVVPPQVPSRQAQELSELLGRVIEEYEHTHGSVTSGDIRQALDLAARRSAGSTAVARGVVAVVVGLALAAGVGVLALVGRSGPDPAALRSWLEVGAVGVLFIAVLVVLLRRRP